MPPLVAAGNGNNLAPCVTSRSRRRRKKAPVVDEKENDEDGANHSNTQDYAACNEATSHEYSDIKSTTSKSRTRPAKKATAATTKKTVRRKGNSQPTTSDATVENDAIPTRWGYALQATEPKKEILRRFLSSLDKVSIDAIASWKDDADLVETLVEASHSMCLRDHPSSAFFVLQDQDTRNSILSACRKVVKYSAENNNPKDVAEAVKGLFVAVHGLRAVSVLSPDVAQSEAILRLLYHIINTVSGALKLLVELTAKAKTTKSKGSLQKLIELAEDTGISAYEAIRHNLLQLSLSLGKSSKPIVFDLPNGGPDDQSQVSWSCLFPTPQFSHGRSTRSKKELVVSTMTPSQLYTITMQSTLAVSRIMMSTSDTKKGARVCISSPESSDVAKLEPPFSGLSMAHATAFYLLQNIILQWAAFMSMNLKDEDGIITKESVSLCQQAHRIIWDTASRASRHEAKQPKSPVDPLGLCLELRKHSLLILLGQSDQSIWGSSQSSSPCVDGVGMDTVLGKKLFEKHFDNVCTMSWKASLNIAPKQSSSPMPDPPPPLLLDFHEKMGDALDKVAGSCGTRESLAYVEYCAYRALHIGPASVDDLKSRKDSCQHKVSSKYPCIFLDIPFGYIHHQSLAKKPPTEGSDHGQPCSVVLSMFFLLLQLQHHLQVNHAGKLNQDYCIDLSSAKDIAVGFQNVFLKDCAAIPLELKLGCFKLLSLVNLPSTIFKISNLPPEELHQYFGDGVLEVACEVMTTCVGPFVHSLLLEGSSEDIQKKLYMWDLIVECYARPAVIWDSFHSLESSGNCFSSRIAESDGAISELSSFLLASEGTLPSSVNVIEKAAKIFASVGKRRANRGESELALIPLLHSLSLFTSLGNDGDASDKYKLPARWCMVAGLFQSLEERKDAATLATAMSIKLEIASLSSSWDFENSGAFVDALAFLSLNTHGVVVCGPESDSKSNISKAQISRLINNFLEDPGQSCSLSKNGIKVSRQALTLKDGISILFHFVSADFNDSAVSERSLPSIYHKHVGSAFTLVGILREILAGGDGKHSNQGSAALLLLTSVLRDLGKTIQLNFQELSPTLLEEALQVYDSVVELLVEEISTLQRLCFTEQDDSIARNSLSAVAYLVASSSLLSESSAFEGVLFGNHIKADGHIALFLPRARKFAGLAWEAANKTRQPIGNIDLACSAVKSASQLYMQNLAHLDAWPESKSTSCNHDVFSIIDDEVLSLLGSTEDRSSLTSFACTCMRWQLSRLQDHLSLQGDQLLAAQVTMWYTNISGTSDDIENQWARSLTTHTLLSGGFLEVARSFNERKNDHDRAAIHNSFDCWRLLADAESYSGYSRLKLFCTARDMDIEVVEEHLHETLTQISDLESSPYHSQPGEALRSALSSWVRSSTLLSLSGACEANGDIQQSISLARLSFKACQEVVTSPSRLRWKRLLGASMQGETPWFQFVIPKLLVRSCERQIDCLQRTAYLYAKLGDHRKSEAYSFAALRVIENKEITATLKSKAKFPDLLACFHNSASASLQEEACRRNAIWLKAKASPHAAVKEGLSETGDSIISFSASKCDTSNGLRTLHQINDLLTMGSYFHDISSYFAEDCFGSFFTRASTLYRAMVAGPSFQKLSQSFNVIGPTSSSDQLLIPIYYQLQLGKIRSLLEGNSTVSPNNHADTSALCFEITNAKLAPTNCRAWAFYYLGLLELNEARIKGGLSKLWSGCSNLEDSAQARKRRGVPKSIKNARSHFSASLSLLGPASDLLTRQALRSLALVTGPEREEEISATSACIFVHTSIGCAPRQALSQALSAVKQDGVVDLLGALDIGYAKFKERENRVLCFLRELKGHVQLGWRFVASTICPTGEILVASLEADDSDIGWTSSTTCVFPIVTKKDAPSKILYDSSNYDAIVKPLDSLILRSQQQLRGVTTSSDASEKYNDASAKRSWWSERNQIDDELKELVEDVERKQFEAACVHRTLFGISESNHPLLRCDSSRSDSSSSKGRGGVSSYRKSDSTEDSPGSKLESSCCSLPLETAGSHSQSECTFLILDENLQLFPFEGMPSFQNRPVCRLPSLPFALASLLESNHSPLDTPVVNPAKASYIIDPEANLGKTKERLLPYIEDLTSRYSWSWSGVTGELPSRDFMEENLARNEGLLLYCGHGGGQSCFSRTQLEQFVKSSESQTARPCRTSVILMGCSSGRLESINRKGSESTAQQPIFFEPEGMALSYLLAGAPCVVANLWDVTDHDIDRYCIRLLERFLDSTQSEDGEVGQSMAQAVADARAVCKMPYIVGCAPVVYGIPCTAKPQTGGTRRKTNRK